MRSPEGLTEIERKIYWAIYPRVTINSTKCQELAREVARVLALIRPSGSPADTIEVAAAQVHASYVDAMREKGIESRKMSWGEEALVPYSELSEAAKDLDRTTARAALGALSPAQLRGLADELEGKDPELERLLREEEQIERRVRVREYNSALEHAWYNASYKSTSANRGELLVRMYDPNLSDGSGVLDAGPTRTALIELITDLLSIAKVADLDVQDLLDDALEEYERRRF